MANSAGAQQQRPVLHRLVVGERVRLELLDASRLTGEVVVLGPQAVTVRTVVRPTPMNAVEVDRAVPGDSLVRAWRYRGTHWKEGAAGGAGLGALGMLMAVSIASGAQDGAECSGCWASAALGGAVIGSLLGAFVGGQIPRWRPIRPWDIPSSW